MASGLFSAISQQVFGDFMDTDGYLDHYQSHQGMCALPSQCPQLRCRGSGVGCPLTGVTLALAACPRVPCSLSTLPPPATCKFTSGPRRPGRHTEMGQGGLPICLLSPGEEMPQPDCLACIWHTASRRDSMNILFGNTVDQSKGSTPWELGSRSGGPFPGLVPGIFHWLFWTSFSPHLPGHPVSRTATSQGTCLPLGSPGQ